MANKEFVYTYNDRLLIRGPDVFGTIIDVADSTLLSGLMGYWKLDESSGTLYDSTANNRDSTAQSVSYSASGKINTALSFNGTSNYVEFGDVCQPTTAISISCWIKIGSTSIEPEILENFGYASAWEGYGLSVYNANAWGYILGNTSSIVDAYVSASTIHNDTWHHLVVTWSGSGNVPNHYTNGSKSNSGQALTGNLSYNLGGFHEGLRFGIGLWDSGYYPGDLDEVGIWNRALTDAEVASLYNSGSGLSHPF